MWDILYVAGILYWANNARFYCMPKIKTLLAYIFHLPSNQTIFPFVNNVSCFPKFDVINLLTLFTQFFFDEMRHLMKLHNGPHLEAMNPQLSTLFELFQKVETFNWKFTKKINGLLCYFFFSTDISMIPKWGLQSVIVCVCMYFYQL